jgi:hypothetical protein
VKIIKIGFYAMLPPQKMSITFVLNKVQISYGSCLKRNATFFFLQWYRTHIQLE